MLKKYLQNPKPRLCPLFQSLSSESCYAVQAVLEQSSCLCLSSEITGAHHQTLSWCKLSCTALSEVHSVPMHYESIIRKII